MVKGMDEKGLQEISYSILVRNSRNINVLKTGSDRLDRRSVTKPVRFNAKNHF